MTHTTAAVAATLDNTGGLLRAKQGVRIDAAGLINRQTAGVGQGIEGRTLTHRPPDRQH